MNIVCDANIIIAALLGSGGTNKNGPVRIRTGDLRCVKAVS